MGWDRLWVWCRHRSKDCSMAHHLPYAARKLCGRQGYSREKSPPRPKPEQPYYITIFSFGDEAAQVHKTSTDSIPFLQFWRVGCSIPQDFHKLHYLKTSCTSSPTGTYVQKKHCPCFPAGTWVEKRGCRAQVLHSQEVPDNIKENQVQVQAGRRSCLQTPGGLMLHKNPSAWPVS